MMFYALAAIVTGIGLGWIWLRFTFRSEGGHRLSVRLQVLGEKKLARHATVALIQVGESAWLIGAHARSLRLLSSLGRIQHKDTPPTLPSTRFGNRVRNAMDMDKSPLGRAFARSGKSAFEPSRTRETLRMYTEDPLVTLAESTPAVVASKEKNQPVE